MPKCAFPPSLINQLLEGALEHRLRFHLSFHHLRGGEATVLASAR